MTNAQKLTADVAALADLIYRADDINPEICQAEFGEDDELINCKHPDEDGGCMECIKGWLEQEVANGENE
jgi:hypothetical protein